MRVPSWFMLVPLVAIGLAASGQTLVPNDLVLNRQWQVGLSGPVAAEFLPDGRLVIIQQTGQIRVRPAAGGALISAGSVPVNVSSERGLLGLAIDPQFATSNRIYLYYSAMGSTADDRHRVAWATIDPVTSIVDVANRIEILRGMFGPANHNGGGLAFGPDGNLYVGVGDTGCNCNCQPGRADNWFPTCLTNLNGKILRVDRDGGIPATNPLVGLAAVPACGANARPEGSTTNGCNAPLYQSETGAPRTEIYNWGFRNPWRFAFDPLPPHSLWIGDVGEVTWEEITISTGPGQHHGWPFREGAHGELRTTCTTATPQATGDCVEPAFEYNHNGGAGSVSGGVFTTHCSWPQSYQGRYWLSDYTADIRAVWSLTPNAARDGITGARADIITNAEGIVHFANGTDGALYMVNANLGQIWRLAPMNPVACPPDDAGVVDSGEHPDAAPGPMDAASDAGPAPPVDAGVGLDGASSDGAAPTDGAAPIDDSGTGPGDAPGADGSTSDANVADGGAGSPRDAGVLPRDDGCGCTTAAASNERPALLGALLLLGLVALRRKTTRRSVTLRPSP